MPATDDERVVTPSLTAAIVSFAFLFPYIYHAADRSPLTVLLVCHER